MKHRMVIWHRIKAPWARLTPSEQNAIMLITAMLVLGLIIKAWHSII